MLVVPCVQTGAEPEHVQELGDAAGLLAEGSLSHTGDKDRRRKLKWQERLSITQCSLATQVYKLLTLRCRAALHQQARPNTHQNGWMRSAHGHHALLLAPVVAAEH